MRLRLPLPIRESRNRFPAAPGNAVFGFPPPISGIMKPLWRSNWRPHLAFLRRRQAPQRSPMKPLKLALTPTRNRRLNEVTGMVLLVAASLLFLALASYRPTDPSFNTVGAVGRPVHNWIGLIGASLSDLLAAIGRGRRLYGPVDAGCTGVDLAAIAPGRFSRCESVRRFPLPGICTRHLRSHAWPSPLDACPACGRPDRPPGGGFPGPISQLSGRCHRDCEHGGDRALSVHHLQFQHRATVDGGSLRFCAGVARPGAQLAFRLGPKTGGRQRRKECRETRSRERYRRQASATGRGEDSHLAPLRLCRRERRGARSEI